MSDTDAGVIGTSVSPSTLFASNEQGVWYDPSDLTTLFQDSAGTIPVTSVEQPVGLMLDKSKGLVLGTELVTNGDFSNGSTGWTASFGSISPSSGTLSVVTSGAVNGGKAVQQINVFSGKTYTITGTIISASSAIGGIRITSSSTGDSTGAIYSISGKNAGTYSFIFTANANTLYVSLLNSGTNAGIDTVVFDNISVRELPGNHAYALSNPTDRRPILKKDSSGYYYLLGNGTSTAMQTNSIDFSATGANTDKMTVIAGIRQLNTTAGIIVELSTATETSNGSFYLVNAESGGTNTSWSLRGTQLSRFVSNVTSYPLTEVVSCNYDIAGATKATETFPRANGVVVPLSSGTGTDAGTGTFGNYPLYLFSRNNGSGAFFSGNLYGLVVRGVLTSDSQLAQVETWMSNKTGVAVLSNGVYDRSYKAASVIVNGTLTKTNVS